MLQQRSRFAAAGMAGVEPVGVGGLQAGQAGGKLAPIRGQQALERGLSAAGDQVGGEGGAALQQQAGVARGMAGGVQYGGVQAEALDGFAVLQSKVGWGGGQRAQQHGGRLGDDVDQPAAARGADRRLAGREGIGVGGMHADARAGSLAQGGGAAVMVVMGVGNPDQLEVGAAQFAHFGVHRGFLAGRAAVDQVQAVWGFDQEGDAQAAGDGVDLHDAVMVIVVFHCLTAKYAKRAKKERYF